MLAGFGHPVNPLDAGQERHLEGRLWGCLRYAGVQVNSCTWAQTKNGLALAVQIVMPK